MTKVLTQVDLSNRVLIDDETNKGGTAFKNETLADFLLAIGGEFSPYITSVSQLESINVLLVECGIRPIEI